MSKKERFERAFYFLKVEGIIRTQIDVANAMGASAPNISSALKGKESILTDSFLTRFAAAFKQISLNWLLYEEGDMLTMEMEFKSENQPQIMLSEIDQDILEEQAKMTARIKELVNDFGHINKTFALKADIELSLFEKKMKGNAFWSVADVHKICDTFRIRRSWLTDGTGQKFRLPDEVLETIPARRSREEQEEGIPLIPVSAMAGALSGDSVQIQEWDIEQRFVIPTFKKSDFCIRIEGNSMEPRYFRGDIVACTRVPLSDIWFQWGAIYVVDTRQGVLVKHVEKGSDNEHITLVSDNPDYKPFEIPTSEIFGVAIINGLIRVE